MVDEHAVSTTMLGPWRSKKYDSRFAKMAGLELPVDVYFGVEDKSLNVLSR
jgi:hypothetical protein